MKRNLYKHTFSLFVDFLSCKQTIEVKLFRAATLEFNQGILFFTDDGIQPLLFQDIHYIGLRLLAKNLYDSNLRQMSWSI